MSAQGMTSPHGSLGCPTSSHPDPESSPVESGEQTLLSSIGK